MKQRSLSLIAAMLASLAGAGVAYATEAGAVPLLSAIDRGAWELHATGQPAAGGVVRKICLGDPARLIQIEHPGLACRQFVIKHDARSVTVSYNCPTGGQGLTTIRRETNGLIQLQSQGIKDGAPFSLSLEGRRTGACGRLTRR